MGLNLPSSHGRGAAQYRRASIDSIDSDPGILHLRHDDAVDSTTPSTSTGELSGIYLGILNVYTTLPQFVGTFISFIVFSILEPGKSPELATDADPKEHHSADGVNAIGVCLFIGALSTFGAAYATQKLKYVH